MRYRSILGGEQLSLRAVGGTTKLLRIRPRNDRVAVGVGQGGRRGVRPCRCWINQNRLCASGIQQAVAFHQRIAAGVPEVDACSENVVRKKR
jgi:hypothetical protein